MNAPDRQRPLPAAPVTPNPGGGATTNPHKGRQGLTRVWYATRNSLAGLKVAYRQESAFRQEVWLAAVMLPCAFWLADTWLEAVVLIGSVVLVLIVELLNSGIEATVDRISFEMHELSGRAKDLASAAVMLSLLLCSAVWLSALIRKLLP